MAHSRERPEPSRSLSGLLNRLLVRDEPTDESTRAALDHIDRVQQRIESVREEVKRGVRSSNKRFRL